MNSDPREDEKPTLDVEYIRRGLEHAAQQVKEGKVAEWDPEEIMSKGRELLARRNKQS